MLTAIAYVDLNPIRARLAAVPEDSAFTSIAERLKPVREGDEPATESAVDVPNGDHSAIATDPHHAEERGWCGEPGGSHAWGRIYCPYNDPECRCGEFCITSIWSTPRNASNHAEALRRVVDRCPYREG